MRTWISRRPATRLVAAAVVATAVGMGGSARADLIVNGSFEDGAGPPAAGTFTALPGGSTAVSGWTVLGPVGSDWVDDGYWRAAAGTRSVDLNALGQGGVAQTFATTAGATYTVTYALSLNPDPTPTYPPFRGVRASAADAGTGAELSFAETTFRFNDVGSSYTNMNWGGYGFSFTAAGPQTTLVFRSTTPTGAGGVALDDVQVAGPPAVPAPPAVVLGGIAAAAVLGLRLRRRT